MCACLGPKIEETFGFTTSYCTTKGAMWRLRKVLPQEKRLELNVNIVVVVFLFYSMLSMLFSSLVHDAWSNWPSKIARPVKAFSENYHKMHIFR